MPGARLHGEARLVEAWRGSRRPGEAEAGEGDGSAEAQGMVGRRTGPGARNPDTSGALPCCRDSGGAAWCWCCAVAGGGGSGGRGAISIVPMGGVTPTAAGVPLRSRYMRYSSLSSLPAASPDSKREGGAVSASLWLLVARLPESKPCGNGAAAGLGGGGGIEKGDGPPPACSVPGCMAPKAGGAPCCRSACGKHGPAGAGAGTEATCSAAPEAPGRLAACGCMPPSGSRLCGESRRSMQRRAQKTE